MTSGDGSSCLETARIDKKRKKKRKRDEQNGGSNDNVVSDSSQQSASKKSSKSKDSNDIEPKDKDGFRKKKHVRSNADGWEDKTTTESTPALDKTKKAKRQRVVFKRRI